MFGDKGFHVNLLRLGGWFFIDLAVILGLGLRYVGELTMDSRLSLMIFILLGFLSLTLAKIKFLENRIEDLHNLKDIHIKED